MIPDRTALTPAVLSTVIVTVPLAATVFVPVHCIQVHISGIGGVEAKLHANLGGGCIRSRITRELPRVGERPRVTGVHSPLIAIALHEAQRRVRQIRGVAKRSIPSREHIARRAKSADPAAFGEFLPKRSR